MQTRIKELRKERKLHQSELAAKINVSQQTVSRIENGDTTLPADILIDLARFFNVSIDYLLYQTDSRRTPDFQIV
ncbi:helix-turn-helix domain-containing protein [Mediterraneibacter glycyrrhizinilyticus]|uniref:helix-turn-helix domain-containing protein n=1 Tax=Mediterraneibacter glycyrrhizinilyticus TaxID=342942 RepID=UPI001D06DD65|nr:helix-turn-helix transcriptional regulator [Mediterraneibacter glycyrrhizinilyticus]MCB6309128.1 helix-turn-helix domain-containing protein [Lachnospiraceae bacterium 210521-DFI.1.109]MCB6426474.1 helix-turn-helix domain-containing protein [Mediterraneibacter glycyrrhizinilyticus]